MDNKIISEDTVKSILQQILSEETSKVKRDDFNRVQFKIDEFQNSLNETIKELHKLESSIPEGLKTISNGRLLTISTNLSNVQKVILQLKDRIKQHKKSTYKQQVNKKGE